MKEKSRKQEIAEALIGLTYRDYEEIFENVVAPISMVQLEKGLLTNSSKYKIVNRKTGEEIMSYEDAVKITERLHKNINK